MFSVLLRLVFYMIAAKSYDGITSLTSFMDRFEFMLR